MESGGKSEIFAVWELEQNWELCAEVEVCSGYSSAFAL